MPDPSWTVKDGGSSQVNGDYFESGSYDKRIAFQKVGGGMHLFWCLSVDRYYINTTRSSTRLYEGTNENGGKYDLPSNPWITGNGQNPPPTITAYVPPPPPPRPTANLLLTEGQVDPAAILDPTPTLAWTYIPANGGLPQGAYQIHIATSYALLEAHMPDVWDSGIVESNQNQIVYAGDPLADFEIYFWAVRVRDTDGLWSKDW